MGALACQALGGHRDGEDPGPGFKERPVWGEGGGHSLFRGDSSCVDRGGSRPCRGGGGGRAAARSSFTDASAPELRPAGCPEMPQTDHREQDVQVQSVAP